MKILIGALFAVSVFAQTAALLPWPKVTFNDVNGKPLSGGKVYTYLAGTTTPRATYTDSTGSTPNTNPVILDSAGRASIWISGVAYKIVLQNSAGVVQWTVDNVSDLGQLLRRDLASTATGYGASLIGSKNLDGTDSTVQARLDAIPVKSIRHTVMDFGAIGDGTTDDTIALQAAIDYSITNKVTMFINQPASCYKTTSALRVLANGLKLVGDPTHEVGPAICYTGVNTNNIIEVGGGLGATRVFNVLLDNFWVYALGGAKAAVKLQNVSEGTVHLYIGNEAGIKALDVGIFCFDCGLYTIRSTILEAKTGIKFDMPPGGHNNIAVYIDHANIFETNIGINIKEGSNIAIRASFVENFDVGIQLDNGGAAPGNAINNVRIADSFIDTVFASTHMSPIAFRATALPGGTQVATFNDIELDNNVLIATPYTPGGAVPYAIDLDLAACAGNCPGKFTLQNNIVGGGATSSIHGTSTNAFVMDRGMNSYLTGFNGSPVTNVTSGTLQYILQQYNDFTVYQPDPALGTMMTVRSSPSQGTGAPTMRFQDLGGLNVLQYRDKQGWLFEPDASYAWDRTFGAIDPADANAPNGFGAHGAAGTYLSSFVGKTAPLAMQTWLKAGRIIIKAPADALADDGANLFQIYGSTRLQGETISVGVAYSALTACSPAISGTFRTVLDSTTQVWGAVIAGGGGARVMAWCNGANWTVYGK